MSRAPKRGRSTVDAEFGREPKDIDFTKTDLQSVMINALNYFNAKLGSKAGQEFLNKKFHDIAWYNVPVSERNPSTAWLFMLEKNGCTLRPELIEKRDNYIARLKELYPKGKPRETSETKPEVKVFKFPEKPHIEEFDEIVDNLYKDYKVTDAIKAIDDLLSKLKKNELDDIYVQASKEFEEIGRIPKDKELRLGYIFLTSSNMRVVTKFYKHVCDKAMFIKEVVKKVIRTPRKKKAVPIEKKLSTLKYQIAFEELKLVSFKPEKLLGSNIVWVFNTKTRDLTIMESKEGFDLKGTTLQNGTSAKVKKIRKAEEIQEFSKFSRAKMLRTFKDWKTNEREGTFRINEDTILLATFKIK